MAVEFILAVVSGLIVTILSEFLRSRHQEPNAALEISRRSEVIVEQRTFIDGEIIQETMITTIEESTFRLPQGESPLKDRIGPFAAGGFVFAFVVVLLLIL